MTTKHPTDEPAVMRELHEIREQLHEQWKDWTPQQLIDHMRGATAEAIRTLGLKVEHAR